ncbi:DUF1016 N-terminal domain-containing protein [Rickettsia amblyommatis]|uniref:DUF1016 N-terminal domain-containing protein n=1 Tax=Rickettsia amblyommatis TaxID=33989 RepID=UPI0006A7C5CD|nr:DUF1016 N-terminal domain-containing protein [Rickettsia amblyommatis]
MMCSALRSVADCYASTLFSVSWVLCSTCHPHIESAKSHVASYANSALVALYWNVGSLINDEILHNVRAEYGAQILSNLSQELILLYGNGFDGPNLSRMVKFSKL